MFKKPKKTRRGVKGNPPLARHRQARVGSKGGGRGSKRKEKKSTPQPGGQEVKTSREPATKKNGQTKRLNHKQKKEGGSSLGGKKKPF